MTEERVKRTRAVPAVDERKELATRFIEVLFEDPWYNALDLGVLRWNVAEELNKACWYLLGHYKPLLEHREERWVCSSPERKSEINFKMGFGDEPREALLRWYISKRAGEPTVSELREQQREDEQATRVKRSRSNSSGMAGEEQDGARRRRHRGYGSSGQTLTEGDEE